MEPAPFKPKYKWTSETIYVDVETGEVLNKARVKTAYKQTKQFKKTTIDEKNLKAHIRRQIECERIPEQGTLW